MTQLASPLPSFFKILFIKAYKGVRKKRGKELGNVKTQSKHYVLFLKQLNYNCLI